MELLFLWLLCGIAAAMIGSQKGEGCAGFMAGVLLGPFGILIALFSKGNRKTCPYCKELIHKDAAVCKHCQRDVKGQSEEQQTAADEMLRQQKTLEDEILRQQKVDLGGVLRERERAQRRARLKEIFRAHLKWISAHAVMLVIVFLALMIVAVVAYFVPLLYDLLR